MNIIQLQQLDRKVAFKYLIGIIVMVHVFPAIFVCPSLIMKIAGVESAQQAPFSWLYSMGWILNGIMLCLYGITRFLEWCFKKESQKQ